MWLQRELSNADKSPLKFWNFNAKKNKACSWLTTHFLEHVSDYKFPASLVWFSLFRPLWFVRCTLSIDGRWDCTSERRLSWEEASLLCWKCSSVPSLHTKEAILSLWKEIPWESSKEGGSVFPSSNIWAVAWNNKSCLFPVLCTFWE